MPSCATIFASWVDMHYCLLLRLVSQTGRESDGVICADVIHATSIVPRFAGIRLSRSGSLLTFCWPDCRILSVLPGSSLPEMQCLPSPLGDTLPSSYEDCVGLMV